MTVSIKPEQKGEETKDVEYFKKVLRQHLEEFSEDII